MIGEPLPSNAGDRPADQRVLVLTGGVIHLVHQLAALQSESTSRMAVLITGVLTRDPPALRAMQATLGAWFNDLRQADPGRFGQLSLLHDGSDLRPGGWDLACLNNQWVVGQRSVVERLAIPRVLVCGDGLGVYYRCARELRAILPSLLNLPIHDRARQVRYALSGRQPLWHRPPSAPATVDRQERQRLFEGLVSSLAAGAAPLVEATLAAPAISSSRPIRREGMRLAISSPWSRATRFISEAKAPGAIPVTLILSSISRAAMRRVR